MRAVPVRPLHILNKSQLFRPALSRPYGEGVRASPRYMKLRRSPPALPFVLAVLQEDSSSSPIHLLSHNAGNAGWQLKLNLLCWWPWLLNMISPDLRLNETAHVTKL